MHIMDINTEYIIAQCLQLMFTCLFALNLHVSLEGSLIVDLRNVSDTSRNVLQADTLMNMFATF